jgi:hypothetical protein
MSYLNLKSRVQNSYFIRIIPIIQEFGCFMKDFIVLFFNKKKKSQESCFSGTFGNSGGDGDREANYIPLGMGS